MNNLSNSESALEKFAEKIDFINLTGMPEDFYKAGLAFVKNGQFDDGIIEFVKIIKTISHQDSLFVDAVKELKSMGFSNSDIRLITGLQEIDVPSLISNNEAGLQNLGNERDNTKTLKPYEILKKIPLNLDGFEDQKIEVIFKIWSWRPIFQVNGEVLLRTSNENQLILKKNDGNKAIITWKPKFLGWDAPQFFLNGNKTQWMEPLKWYELLSCAGIPIIISFLNLGVFLVFPLCFLINIKIFRTQDDIVIKYFLTGIASFLVSLLPFVCIIFATPLFYAFSGK